MVICLERDADLHMAQLMPLQLTVSCFSKIQIGFTFLVPAYPGSPGKRAVKRVCVFCGALSEAIQLLIHTTNPGQLNVSLFAIWQQIITNERQKRQSQYRSTELKHKKLISKLKLIQKLK